MRSRNCGCVLGGSLLGTVELEKGIDSDFPDSALRIAVVLVFVLSAAKFAFHLDKGV